MRTLLLAAVALALAGPAKADKALIPPEMRGVWCLESEDGAWGYYQRTGCRGDEVEGVYWLKLYANGDYRTIATYCRARSKPMGSGWIEYRCTREGQRKPIMRTNKWNTDDLGKTLHQGGFEQ